MTMVLRSADRHDDARVSVSDGWSGSLEMLPISFRDERSVVRLPGRPHLRSISGISFMGSSHGSEGPRALLQQAAAFDKLFSPGLRHGVYCPGSWEDWCGTYPA